MQKININTQAIILFNILSMKAQMYCKTHWVKCPYGEKNYQLAPNSDIFGDPMGLLWFSYFRRYDKNAKLQRRKCLGAEVKERKCEDATAKREDVEAKVRRRTSDTTIATSPRTFALLPLHFLNAFSKSWSITIVQYSPKVCRLMPDIICMHALTVNFY